MHEQIKRSASATTLPEKPVRAWIRRYVRKLWASRGGGFYGFVATLMFIYLEIIDIAGDILDMGGARISLGWLISFLVSNMIDVVKNTVRAAIWPATWISQFGVGIMSAVLIGVMYVGYMAVRPSVLRMLREPGETEATLELKAVARPEV
jgi:hypothetical protein